LPQDDKLLLQGNSGPVQKRIVKKIRVLIPDGDDERTIKVVQSLGVSRKAEVFVMTTRKNVVRYSRFCRAFNISENGGGDSINASVERVLKECAIDVILPVAEKGIRLIHHADWGEEYKTAPVPDLNTLETVGNKHLLGNLCRDLGLNYPKSILVNGRKDVNKLGEIERYPVLIKPVRGAGGHGIALAKEKEAVHDHFSGGLSAETDKEYIIQEYIDGPDIDISILCRQGKILAFTIQEPIEKVQNVFSFAKAIRFLKDKNIFEYCENLVAHLRWSGVAHLDFKKEKKSGKLFLIDFNPRFWGTLLGSTRAGVNFPLLACYSGMGFSFPVPAYDEIDYYELERNKMVSFVFRKREGKKVRLRHSSLYFALIDPGAVILKRPAFLKGKRV
jgi:D-aspartate ligase